jgi:hypothetical protein
LTHYGNFVKNFKFLKEVKILSNFVRANSHAQCEFASAEGMPRRVYACQKSGAGGILAKKKER